MEKIYLGEISKESLNSTDGQKQMQKMFREQLSRQKKVR